MTSDWNLENELATLRTYRAVTFTVMELEGEPSDDFAVGDHVLSAVGFAPIGASWRRIDGTTALDIFASLLEKDLAYESQRMSRALAVDLATWMLSHVADADRYLTNGTWEQLPKRLSECVVQGASWASATDATFDAGIVWFGRTHAGIFWVADED